MEANFINFTKVYYSHGMVKIVTVTSKKTKINSSQEQLELFSAHKLHAKIKNKIILFITQTNMQQR